MAKETIAIVGLGYVGLPLACLCASKGYAVKGLDLDERKVSLVNAGKSPIKDSFVEQGLAKYHASIWATKEPKLALSGSSIVIVCVPTPTIDNKPDLSLVEAACREIAPYITQKKLVIIESTVYPGTVEEIVKPILEGISGLEAGRDFYLGHCPERIDPGNKTFTIDKIPRVLACLGPAGAKRAEAFYKSIITAEILVLSEVKSAEAVKVMENTFRDINIAFVNELAKSFDSMGIDITEVIRGASTKPFGFMPFYPGPGVGGHCIAEDPYYLIARAEKAGFEHKLLRIAREINESMPAYVIQRLEEGLLQANMKMKDTKVAVLGLAYKPEVDDSRKSPGMKIARKLFGKVAGLKAFDPFIRLEGCPASLEEALEGADAVILATQHRQLVEALKVPLLKSHGIKVVIDARNCLDKDLIESEGMIYKGIGR